MRRAYCFDMEPLKRADIKIRHVKKVTDFKYLNLFLIDYTDREKCEKQWIFASRSDHQNPLQEKSSTPNAVVIVPYHVSEKKLVLIKEYRVALGGYQYGFPAGLVDKGETVGVSAQRELFEETGLKITKTLKKSPGVYSSSGMTDESVSMYFAECSGEASNIHNEASEDIEIILVSQQEAKDLLQDDTLKFDVKTWIVLNHFASSGSI